MLHEIETVRQIPGETPRRWFNNEALDLIVWQDERGAVIRFQLVYDKDRDERLVEWMPDELRHYRVDLGEHHALQHDMTPILLPLDDAPPLHELAQQFLARSGDMDRAIALAVLARLTR